MADWTKAELANKVLERLNIKAKNQGADTSDLDLVTDAIDGVHDQLAKLRLVPFETSAIPTWAQIPMVKIMAGVCAPDFGFTGTSLQEKIALGADGKKDLVEQVQNDIAITPAQVVYW